MRYPFPALIVAVAVFAVGLPSLGAQSLGEAARREEQRRKSIKAEAKVYTNKDLPDVPPATAPREKPAADVPAAAAAAGDTKAEASETKPSETKPSETKADGALETPTRDQAYWGGRLKALRTALERNQTYLAALQSRINGLATDFVNRDDPAQRAVIAGDRQRAIDEHERLTTQVENDRKAIANLEEEARRAGVPPGWLR